MSEPLDDSEALGIVIWGAILTVLILSGAFVFKVWNERQMTRELHEQTQAQSEIAAAVEAWMLAHCHESAVRDRGEWRKGVSCDAVGPFGLSSTEERVVPSVRVDLSALADHYAEGL